MLIAVGSMALMGGGLGGMLGLASRYLAVKENPLEQELQSLLPGANCAQCGYVGCSQAAAALARGEAPVTLCPPGGKAVAERLAKKLGVKADLSAQVDKEPEFAVIDEDLCIGCTRCIRECTADAILGAPKQMHTVLLDNCHGCAKCFKVCPTEAIRMCKVPVTLGSWHWDSPAASAGHVHAGHVHAGQAH